MARGRMAGDRPGPGVVVLPMRRAGLGGSAAVGRRPMSWRTAPSPAAAGWPSRGGLAAAVRLRRPGISGAGVARRLIRRLAAGLAAPEQGESPRGRRGRSAGPDEQAGRDAEPGTEVWFSPDGGVDESASGRREDRPQAGPLAAPAKGSRLGGRAKRRGQADDVWQRA